MNILIVHNFYKIPGGEDTVVNNERKMLCEHGHKVVLYTRSNSELDLMSKIKKIKLPFTTIYNPQTVKDVIKIIRDEKIDIVHVHNTLNLISPSVYYAAQKCGVKVIQTVHNFRFECMGACFYRDGKICEDCLSLGNKCSIKHSCYRGSKLQTGACLLSNWYHRKTGIYKKLSYICLTEFNKDKLLHWQHKGAPVLQEKQIYVKPNFTNEIDISNFEKTREDYYLFVGRVEEIKGIGIIIDAFSELAEKRIKIVGNGTELKKYKELVSERNIKNVEFLGHLNKEELFQEYYNAKATIVASQWYETFGMVVAESYSVGTPVIAGDIGNIGNIVEHKKTGIKFEYNNPNSLIEAINTFDSMSREELSKNAFGKYKTEFTADINYEILMKIYKG